MDSDAPRVLAHAFLYEADAFLKEENCDFARFMDDIDVGVDSIADAKRILRDLDVTLKSRGVRLNSGKTHILTSLEAKKYFCARENATLDLVIEKVQKIGYGSVSGRAFLIMSAKYFKRQYRRSQFSYGNGEKIIKRFITLFSISKMIIPEDILFDLLKNRPGVRQNVFLYLQQQGIRRKVLQYCRDLLKEGFWIDDASAFFLSSYIINCNFKNHKVTKKIIIEISNILLDDKSNSRFMSGLWIASKFYSPAELFSLIAKNQRRWVSNPDLGRFAGSLIVRFNPDTKDFAAFRSLILHSHNKEAVAATRFGWKLMHDASAVNKLMANLKSPNASMPNDPAP